MEVLVSAQAGLLAIKSTQGFRLESIRTQESLDIGPRELSYHFLGCNDLTVASVKVLEDARKHALAMWCAERALVLFSFLIDPFETVEEVSESATEIEYLLSLSDGAATELENRLYSKELSFPINYSSIAEVLKDMSLTKLVLDTLLERQPHIARVALAFDEISESAFIHVSKEHFRSIATLRGCFRELVNTAATGGKIDRALFSLYSKLSDQPDHRELVKQWTESFERTPRIRRDWDAIKESPALYIYRNSTLSGRTAYENAMRQQAAILERVKAGDTNNARKYVNDLIVKQKNESEPEHLAKSLTRLSTLARDLQAFELSLEWARAAAEFKSDDPRTHTQMAEALVHFGRFAEAEESLRQAEVYGENSFAVTYRARIMRMQHQLEEALETYERAAVDFKGTNDEQYALSGIAEVLRDMGRLDEALAAYEVAAKRFPDSVVILNGRAAVLVNLGRFEEATHFYEQALLVEYDVATDNGLASILYAQGRFEEAEGRYRANAESNPYDVASRCGLVEVLQVQGRDKDAISLARETVERFPESILAWSTLGLCLQRANLIDEAAEVYDDASKRFSFAPVFASGLARVERIRGRYEKALQTFEKAAARFPNDKSIHAGRAAMLRRLGRADDALAIYEDILRSNNGLRWAVNAQASIYIYQRRFEDALRLLDVDNPQTKDEWKAFLLRAILDDRTGHKLAAEERLAWGLDRVPFERTKSMFKAGLAKLKLEAGQSAEAVTLTENLATDVTSLVRLHALASDNQEGPARALLAVLRASFLPEQYAEVREEIAKVHRLVPGKPAHGPEWLFEMESAALLLEAA